MENQKNNLTWGKLSWEEKAVEDYYREEDLMELEEFWEDYDEDYFDDEDLENDLDNNKKDF